MQDLEITNQRCRRTILSLVCGRVRTGRRHRPPVAFRARTYRGWLPRCCCRFGHRVLALLHLAGQKLPRFLTALRRVQDGDGRADKRPGQKPTDVAPEIRIRLLVTLFIFVRLESGPPWIFCDILDAWRKIPGTKQFPAKTNSTLRPIGHGHDLHAPVVDAEIEADMIRGVLESSGIPSILVRNSTIPSLGSR